jgi:hypothetical protein
MNESPAVGSRSFSPANSMAVHQCVDGLLTSRHALRVAQWVLIMLTLVMTSGCEGFLAQKPAPQEQTKAPPPPPLPSAAPIAYAAKSDIMYAQRTLNKLGYNAGIVDGIWGPQSARAIRNFEKKYQLDTANGLLSELNLFMLEKFSNTSREQQASVNEPSVPRGNGISAKLDRSTPLSNAPQLVILDRSYPMLAKPNPFSEKIATLDAGSGIYVISLQEGWYEVESEQQIKGFVKAD